ncbi:unnamed protein product [Prunus brigantina]
MSTRNEDNHSDSDSDLEEMAHHMIICMHIYEYWQSYVDRTTCHNSVLSGHEYVQELLNGHPDRIYDSFRMDKHVFQRLCYTLESLNLLQNDRHKCIGAIDGTHVAAWAPAQKQTSYRGRKILITQNVMCACSFDMMFTFVYTGWEGTANDSRVFIDAVMRPENEFPFPDEGYYYVVDAGYSNVPGFLAPYRGERYHLRDYRGPRRAPRGPM